MAAESYWSWLLSAWLSSPGVAWFLFFNVIVGAVVVLSWGQQGGDATLSRRRRLTRSASSMVMERLRSLSSSFSFHSVADYGSITPPASQLHHAQEQENYTPPVMNMAEPGAVAAAGQSGTAAMAPPRAPLATAAEDVRAAPSSASGGEEEEAEAESGEKMHIFLDEVRAVAPRSPPAATAVEAAAAATAKMPRKRESAKLSEIVKRRAYGEVEEKSEVNARAERFIRQFREDLKLERLNSILGYSRCADGAPAQ